VEDKGGGKTGLFQKLAQSDNARKLILVIGAAGILLILLSSLFGGKSAQTKAKQADTSASSASAEQSSSDYAAQLEASLTDVIRRIQGAGEPHVLVTLEEGAAQVYATEEKRSTQQDTGSGGQNADTTENSYLIVKDADGSEHALEVTQRQPKVQGVVVTCPGASQPSVQQAVIDAVSTAAGISSAKVCVVASNG
jgi:stage III sporulation protein AG